MKVIINCDPDDFILAVRAAKAHMSRNPNEPSSMIIFDDGSEFLVTKRGESLSVKSLAAEREKRRMVG